MSENNIDLLIIDDNPDIRKILKIETKDLGFSSKTVATSSGAIIALKESKFKFILLDIMLNGGEETSGKVLEFLKGNENLLNKEAKIIIVSGVADEDFQKRNIDKVAKIFPKPLDTDSLLEFLKKES